MVDIAVSIQMVRYFAIKEILENTAVQYIASSTTITRRMLAIRGQADSLDVVYGNLKARGSDFSITAKSAADILKADKNFHHVSGRFAASRISVDDGAGSRLFLKRRTVILQL